MDAYITRDTSGKLIMYKTHNYFAEKFDDDRKEIRN